jgi:hypothetical protein
MPAKPELLGLYWTVSGPVVVYFGREWSYFSWADRCAEARKVGFAGLGIWHADLEHVLETETLAEMKQAMDDKGYVRVCQDHGYTGPWGVETLSEELRNNTIDVIFRRAYEATAAQFA